MADINVERRTRSIWPWVIGLLVLAVLAWLLLDMFSDDRDEVRVETTTSAVFSVEAPRAA